MRRRVIYASAGLAILLMLVSTLFVGHSPSYEGVEVNVRIPRASQGPTLPPSVASPIAPTISGVDTSAVLPAAVLPKRNTTLSQQYAEAKDLKPIVDQAKLHPESGSYFYAAIGGARVRAVAGYASYSAQATRK